MKNNPLIADIVITSYSIHYTKLYDLSFWPETGALYASGHDAGGRTGGAGWSHTGNGGLSPADSGNFEQLRLLGPDGGHAGKLQCLAGSGCGLLLRLSERGQHPASDGASTGFITQRCDSGRSRAGCSGNARMATSEKAEIGRKSARRLLQIS